VHCYKSHIQEKNKRNKRSSPLARKKRKTKREGGTEKGQKKTGGANEGANAQTGRGDRKRNRKGKKKRPKKRAQGVCTRKVGGENEGGGNVRRPGKWGKKPEAGGRRELASQWVVVL